MNRGIILALAFSLGMTAFTDRAAAQSDGDEATASQRAELEDQLAEARRQMREAQQQMERAARELARTSGELNRTGAYARVLSAFDRRARLGVNVGDDSQGARVLGVTPGGPADDAGIRTGDVIVSIDGAEITAGNGQRPVDVVIAELENVEPGDEVSVGVLRDGERRDFVVEADNIPGFVFYGANGDQGARPAPLVTLGAGTRGSLAWISNLGRWADMELVDVTPELGAYFGTETGLLVVHAPRDDQLKLVDGDVIIDIGGRAPTSPEHAMRILNSFEPGETLEITIMRKQRRSTLEIVVPGPPAAG